MAETIARELNRASIICIFRKVFVAHKLHLNILVNYEETLRVHLFFQKTLKEGDLFFFKKKMNVFEVLNL